MRKRKAVDTIIRQYKYSVSTDLKPLPPEVWDVARRMQSAWNALIPAYADSALAALNRDYASAWTEYRESNDEARYRAAMKTLGATKRDIWLQWDKLAREIIAPFGLDYSQGPNVIERFNGCIKANRTCVAETELTHVQLPFIFPGSAAIPVVSLHNPQSRRWRIVIEGYNSAMFANNSHVSRRERRMVYLELGLSRDVPIPLRIDWHRELPAKGTVKRVLLCGKKVPFRGWRWHVLFQVEQPISQTAARRDCGVSLRICWTRLDDSIVVMQWKADDGREGFLTWSLSPTNRADRNTASRHPEWSDWILSYRDLEAYKTQEFALAKGSEARMRMRERRRRVEERWQARRRWLYRNAASWLVKEYAVIRIPKLDVKGIAEDDTKTGALAGADRWRQVAAPGDLLSIIKETAEKHGRRTEEYSQTSTAFQSVTGVKESLRDFALRTNVEMFDCQWNA